MALCHRVLVAALIVALAWTPWALVWGDDFMAAASTGQSTGTELRASTALPTVTNGSVEFPAQAGGRVRVDDLFPGSAHGSQSEFSNYFGYNTATVNAGYDAQNALTSEASAAGDAYRALRDAAARPRLDLGQAQAWSATDDVTGNIGELTRQFADCTTETTFTEGSRSVRIPEYHVCERQNPLPATIRARGTTSVAFSVTYYTVDQDGVSLVIDTMWGSGVRYDPVQGGSDLIATLGEWQWLDPDIAGQIDDCRNDPFCHLSAVCSRSIDFMVPGVVISGYEGTYCQELSVSTSYIESFSGPMECWTDTQGDRHCPVNEGGEENCAALDDDPNCTRVKTTCLSGAESPAGYCYISEETWNCPSRQAVPTLTRQSTVRCGGLEPLPGEPNGSATAVRCIGSDCAQFDQEQSADFAKAASALQAAQMAGSDMDCSGGSDCAVFAGQEHQCKRAVSGIVNCCKTPGNASLSNYLDLVFTMSRINNAIMGLDSTNAVRGAWQTLTGPISDAYSAVTTQFTSAAETLMGNTTSSLTDFGFSAAMDQVTQQIMAKAAEWTAKLFGETAANTLFASATGGPAVSGGVVSSSGVALAPMLASVLTVVMWVYLIYQVVMILIKIIWKCTKDEFELGSKRDLKSCVFVGGYCKSRVLGYCIEKRDTYCCFTTPFARIVQEQARPQLGRRWGTPKEPDCAGIGMSELEALNWDAINLDEWLALLAQTGHFPNPNNVSLDQRTGSGSVLAGTQGRPDAAARTTERVGAVDVDSRRTDAEEQLWREIQAAPR